MDWLVSQVDQFPQPFLGYFHFLPPHRPYVTHVEFYNRFQGDGLLPAKKPEDVFSEGESREFSLARRQQYDEYILYLDQEFGRLFDRLQARNLLDDTWLILTSDHGEMFERGIIGHDTPVLYEPVIRIPLMIFEPGRTTRTDIFDRTSAVDLLPTLLKITGGQHPEWTDGTVLPPFSNDTEPFSRNLYALDSRDTAHDSPMEKVALTTVKGDYKLMYFSGYDQLRGKERVELYNIAEDLEELNNLYGPQSEVGNTMLDEIKAKLREMNKPYL
jgi:arylsulfatase A-like enzyme